MTDRTIGAALAAGAGCVDSIADKCGAGAHCGGCWPELERLIQAHSPRCTTVASEQAA